MKLRTLRDVFADSIRDLYNAETQLVKALPRMAKAASSESLRGAFEHHLHQTRGQLKRLERICETLDIRAKGKTCKAMKGLVEEGAEVIAADGDCAARDAALIAAAQKVEHYEIAGYGAARTFAHLLGEQEAARLLDETLQEERAEDLKLTEVAESGINSEAAGSPEVVQSGRQEARTPDDETEAIQAASD